MEWRAKFKKLQSGKEIVSLTWETSADLRLLETGGVIVCTPTQVRKVFPFYFHLLTVGTSFHDDGDNAKTFKTSVFFLLLMRCS